MHREPLAGAERKPIVALCQTWESNIQGDCSVATAGKIILKRMDVRNSKAWKCLHRNTAIVIFSNFVFLLEAQENKNSNR